MKKLNPIVEENQTRFNNAYDLWIKEGAPKGGKNWDIMFNSIFFAAQNKAKAMLKKKAFIESINDKALDCALLIMERDIYGKKIKIKSLGAYVGYPLLNLLFAEKVIFEDKLYQLPDNAEYEEEKEEEGKTFYLIEGYGIINQDQITEDFIFQQLWKPY